MLANHTIPYYFKIVLNVCIEVSQKIADALA